MLDTINATALRQVVLGHREQIGLCRTLELIADALPNDLDPALCRAAAGTIHRIMARVVEVEGEALRREMERDSGHRLMDLTATCQRLLRENAEDLSYAEEVQEALNALSKGHQTMSADALGYMLRGFFEARRRRIALEQEILTALVEMPQ